MVCDPGLSTQLKSASYAALKRITGEDPGDVPVLMSGAGHDAMAMSHLTKVSHTRTLYLTSWMQFPFFKKNSIYIKVETKPPCAHHCIEYLSSHPPAHVLDLGI